MLAKNLALKMLPMPVLARASWWKYWFIGEWELHQLSDLCSSDGLSIDVGANVGNYSYALRKLGRDVISFEPDRAYRKRLHALLGRQSRIEEIALSNRSGTGVMRVPHVDGGAYGGALGSLSAGAVPDDQVAYSYVAELRSLDSYGFKDVAFIKVDVEGYEEAVIEGAEDTLRRSRPVLLVEIEERHNPGGLDRMMKRLAPLGYSGFFFYHRKLHQLVDFSPEIHQAVANIDANRREYVNNFVFKPD